MTIKDLFDVMWSIKEVTFTARAPEAIQKVCESVEEAPRQWVSLYALVTVAEAMELKRFFEARGIEFRRA